MNSADLSIAFPDQGDDSNVSGVLAAHCAEQGAFTDTAAAKNTDPLSQAAGQKTIYGANTRLQWQVQCVLVPAGREVR